MSTFLTPYGSRFTVILPLLNVSQTTMFQTSAYSPIAGDIKVSADGSASTNILNDSLCTYASVGFQYVLAASETSCRHLYVSTVSQAYVADDYFIVETTDHHLAAKPNGVTFQALLNTRGATSFTAEDAAGENGTWVATALGQRFVKALAVVVSSDVASDLGCSCIITGYSYAATTATFTCAGGWNRTPTGTANTMRVNIYAGAIGVVEALGSIALATINAECDTAMTDYDAATGTELAATNSYVTTADAAIDALVTTVGAAGVGLTSVGIAAANYSGVTVRVHPMNYSGMTVAVDDIAPAAYSGVTVGIDNIAPASLLSMSIDTGGVRYIQDAFAAMRNKVDLSSSVGTVYAGDDASSAFTMTVTRTNVDALTGLDPK